MGIRRSLGVASRVAPFLSFCRTGWQRTRQKRGPNDSLSCTSAATDDGGVTSTMASVHGEEGGEGGGERSEKCSRSGKRVKKMCARFQTTIETGGRRRKRRRRLSEEQTTQSHARREGGRVEGAPAKGVRGCAESRVVSRRGSLVDGVERRGPPDGRTDGRTDRQRKEFIMD